jgi:hypothetical protein
MGRSHSDYKPKSINDWLTVPEMDNWGSSQRMLRILR